MRTHLNIENMRTGLTVINDDGRVGRLIVSYETLAVSVGWGDSQNQYELIEGDGWDSVVQCDTCGDLIEREDKSISTGYGTDKDGGHFCYECCANEDRRIMRETGRHTLYLVCDKDPNFPKVPGTYRLTNWPGTLSIPVQINRRILHRSQITTFTFRFEGQRWYGRNSGDTQIAWVKRYKEKK